MKKKFEGNIGILANHNLAVFRHNVLAYICPQVFEQKMHIREDTVHF